MAWLLAYHFAATGVISCLGLLYIDVCSTVGVMWAVNSVLPMLTELSVSYTHLTLPTILRV